MITVALQDVCKSFGMHEVLKGVSLTLQDGERMGLVGVNGSGKSTLMKIIAGVETPDSGSVSIRKDLKTGYLDQQGDMARGKTVLETLESVFEPLDRMEDEMRRLEEEMAGAADDAAALKRLGGRYDALTHEFERQNGYGRHSAVQGVLTGLGLKERQDMDAGQLSGGERTRLCLGRLLLTSPDLLLLDEPTNHLDLKSITWLEGYLNGYRGTVLVISHDRYFLDKVCGKMTELLLGNAETYTGNYTEYARKRAEVYEIRMRAWEQQQKEIERQKAVIAMYRRFNREKSIRLAESREKRLEKMERLDKPQEEGEIHFRFAPGRRSGDDVLAVTGLRKSFGERTLLSDVRLDVLSGDRIALIGDNGAGKTTLFRCLTGETKPEAGRIQWGTGVDIGYYDQHQAGLHDEKTVLNEVWDDFPKLAQNEVRGALGLFLFTGDEVLEAVGTLSGGEKGRVALTKLMLKKDNTLLLDEPTNHLDMDSREVLENALEEFDGTIIAISHDRYFINRFAKKVCVLENGTLRTYEGNYDDYLEHIGTETADEPEQPQITRTALDKQKRKSREEERLIREQKERQKQLEDEIGRAEAELAELEKRLADPELYRDSEQAAQVGRQYNGLRESIDELYKQWMM